MRTSTTIAAAGSSLGWVVAFLDAVDVIHLTLAQSQFALAVGITLSAAVMHCVRRRPLAAAYDLGYEEGRRDAMRGPSGGRVVQMRKRDLEAC